MSRPRALVIAMAPVDAAMRGVAIRAYELARVLGTAGADVTLAGWESDSAPSSPPGVRVATYRHRRPDALRPLIAEADVVVAQPQPPIVAAWLARSRARLVFDLYDPEPFENLALLSAERSRARRLWLALTLDRLATALRTGHHFLCASEAQRDLWTGALLAERAITFERYAADPSFGAVLVTVPFGVPDEAPVAVPGEGPRARFPQIAADDRVLLWNGGLWSWLDPLLVVRAVARLAGRDPRVRLVFMGGSAHRAAADLGARTAGLAASLGLLDRVVFLNDEWVPYERRASWLLGADAAVSAQEDHLETRYAFRTRLLDCFWTRLPVVCTSGDELARRVDRDQLGAVAPPGDETGLAQAMERVLAAGRAAYGAALARAAAELAWPRVAAPLVELVLGSGARPARPGRTARALAPAPAQLARTLAYRLAARLVR